MNKRVRVCPTAGLPSISRVNVDRETLKASSYNKRHSADPIASFGGFAHSRAIGDLRQHPCVVASRRDFAVNRPWRTIEADKPLVHATPRRPRLDRCLELDRRPAFGFTRLSDRLSCRGRDRDVDLLCSCCGAVGRGSAHHRRLGFCCHNLARERGRGPAPDRRGVRRQRAPNLRRNRMVRHSPHAFLRCRSSDLPILALMAVVMTAAAAAAVYFQSI